MSQPAVEKNKAIVLLKKAGMPMNEVIRCFGDDDRGSAKFNYYRVWRRDKDRYDLVAFVRKHLQPVLKKYQEDGNNKPATSSRTGTH